MTVRRLFGLPSEVLGFLRRLLIIFRHSLIIPSDLTIRTAILLTDEAQSNKPAGRDETDMDELSRCLHSSLRTPDELKFAARNVHGQPKEE